MLSVLLWALCSNKNSTLTDVLPSQYIDSIWATEMGKIHQSFKHNWYQIRTCSVASGLKRIKSLSVQFD